MLKKIKNNISHPKYAFLYIKDKLSSVFLYILILTMLISLPIILLGTINARELVPNSNDLDNNYYYLYQNDFEVVNSKLITNDKSYLIDVGIFNILFGNEYYEKPGFYIEFNEVNVKSYYLIGQNVRMNEKNYTYEELELNNFKFIPENYKTLSTKINNIYYNDKLLITGLIISSIFINLIDLLFVILLLSLFAHLSRRLPFKFSEHFKINTYIATIYAITTLIFSLFNLGVGDFIPIIIAYIYQLIAYRSIRIVNKIKVRKKDE